MRLTVPLNPESLAHWTELAAPAAAGTKPACITLPGDPRRYAVAGVTPRWDPDPEHATLDARLLEVVPLRREDFAASVGLR